MTYRVEYYNTFGEMKTKQFNDFKKGLSYFKRKAEANFESYLIENETNAHLKAANY